MVTNSDIQNFKMHIISELTKSKSAVFLSLILMCIFFFLDPPEIEIEQSWYQPNGEKLVEVELLCTVHANPDSEVRIFFFRFSFLFHFSRFFVLFHRIISKLKLNFASVASKEKEE